MRARALARGLPVLALLACTARPPLPAPALPLVPSEDAPFRARPPALEQASAAQAPALPAVEAASLENGLSLWVVHRPELHSVVLSLAARDAGTFDARVDPELVQLTTRAIVEGGTIWSDGRTVDPPAVNGRQVSFTAYPTHSSFELQLLGSALAAGVEVLARSVRFPAFTEDSWDYVRLDEAEAIRQASGVRNLLLQVTASAAFDEELGQRAAPTHLERVKSAVRDDVRQVYREAFGPASCALIAVGDVTLAQLRELAQAAFGDWQAAREPRVIGRRLSREPASPERRVHLLATDERPQAEVLIVQPAPASTAQEDELPFALLAELSVGAFRSRANTRLRHGAGLTYGVRPYYLRGRASGMLLVGAAFEAEQAVHATEQLLATLEEVQQRAVSPSELDAAKSALMQEIRRRAASNSVLAADLGAVFAMGRAPEWFHSVRDRLAAIGAADVQRVAQQYLEPAHAQIGVYGSASLRHRFARLGSVKVYVVGKQEAY